MSYALRWYQREAVDATWDYLCQRQGNPVIVLPTGSGKSVVIAQLCRDAVERFRGRVLVLAHRKELLRQNAEKIGALLPGLPIGVYSAGLRSKDTEPAIVVAGIQSCYQHALAFDRRHLVVIDEVHLVPASGYGMYQQFLTDLARANPRLRCVGLTATPYRLDDGDICGPENVFQRVCYSADIQRLIADGFLCRLTSKSAGQVDVRGLHKRAGEFILAEQESLFGDGAIVRSACEEIVARAEGRQSILVFCAGVNHAHRVAECLESITGGEPCGVITGETGAIERQEALARFAGGRLRWCVNVDVLTTGFDCPRIDAIAILRATASPGLFAQICGRGFRLHPDKQDCLVLDFGGNIERHGPIDAIEYERRARAGLTAETPTKTCPACGELVPAGKRQCACGFLFPFAAGAVHDGHADTARDILSTPETWDVVSVTAAVHRKRGATEDAPATLRMDYIVTAEGGNIEQKISEWVCVEHTGFARQKAWKWWSERSVAAMPDTAIEAVELFERGAIATPRKITTQREGRFYRVVGAEMDDIPREWWSGELDEIPF